MDPIKKTFSPGAGCPPPDLGEGPERTGDIADALKVKITRLGPVPAKLIGKGMIYSPAHGDMAFTVPLFGEFMVPAIPAFKAREIVSTTDGTDRHGFREAAATFRDG